MITNPAPPLLTNAVAENCAAFIANLDPALASRCRTADPASREEILKNFNETLFNQSMINIGRMNKHLKMGKIYIDVLRLMLPFRKIVDPPKVEPVQSLPIFVLTNMLSARDYWLVNEIRRLSGRIQS